MKKDSSPKNARLFQRRPGSRRRRAVRIATVVRIGARSFAACCAVCAALLAAVWLRADQIQMQNGDHYVGKVLSLDTNTLTLKSDLLGTVHLPREKVALITLGSGTGTNVQRAVSAAGGQVGATPVALTNGVVDLSSSLRQLGANTNFIDLVRAQF